MSKTITPRLTRPATQTPRVQTSVKKTTVDTAGIKRLPGTWQARKAPAVATAAKAFVDAYALPARNQMEIVECSKATNRAADGLLKQLTENLGMQLTDRNQNAAADKLLKEDAAFRKKIGPIKSYRLDPERGTNGSLEDNGARFSKVLERMAKLSAQLGKVNAEPAGEFQNALTRSASGDATKAEVDFAIAFQKAYNVNADDAIVKQTQAFFKALPRKVDSQIEMRGGSAEPMERFGLTAGALKAFAKTLPAMNQ